ncbi:MAG: 2,5-diamino-6-(ribosylamino)-4(3H)-pyrimidinone 5'-phosphate reductase [Halobacteriaceae archaeon]
MRTIVNAAMSVDGKLSTRNRTQIAISGSTDFDRVDELRAESDGIMVGIGTILADDPTLTTDRAENSPIRIIIDSDARTPPDAAVFETDIPVYVFVSDTASATQIDMLEEVGATVFQTSGERVDLQSTWELLDQQGIDQLMVEGGGELIFSLFEGNFVDELRLYIGSLIIGGKNAPTLVDGDGFTADFPHLSLESIRQIDDGVFLHYTV